MSGFRSHRLLQLVIDAGIVALSWFLAFELRFDQGLPVYYDTLLRRTILVVVAIKVTVFLLFGFHRRWWRYVSVHDMWSAARGVLVASLLAYVTVYLVSPVHNVRLPRSVAVMDLLITLALIAGARLLARTVIERPRGGVVARGKEVIVVGAGDAGRLVVQEMQRSRMLSATPIGFVDDDRTKRNSRILGVRVLGSTDELPRIIREYQPDEVLIAIPSASGDLRRRGVGAPPGANGPV
jgi:FlaA1/EpsC-like NDP-sugar epimerase